jgi:hypothetical protein
VRLSRGGQEMSGEITEAKAQIEDREWFSSEQLREAQTQLELANKAVEMKLLGPAQWHCRKIGNIIGEDNVQRKKDAEETARQKAKDMRDEFIDRVYVDPAGMSLDSITVDGNGKVSVSILRFEHGVIAGRENYARYPINSKDFPPALEFYTAVETLRALGVEDRHMFVFVEGKKRKDPLLVVRMRDDPDPGGVFQNEPYALVTKW